MAKVIDYDKWDRLILDDRCILPIDYRFMSWQQVQALDQMDVIDVEEEDGLVTLILSQN